MNENYVTVSTAHRGVLYLIANNDIYSDIFNNIYLCLQYLSSIEYSFTDASLFVRSILSLFSSVKQSIINSTENWENWFFLVIESMLDGGAIVTVSGLSPLQEISHARARCEWIWEQTSDTSRSICWRLGVKSVALLTI